MSILYAAGRRCDSITLGKNRTGARCTRLQHQSVKAKKEHKPYVAPTYKRLTPEEAKDLLLRRADIDDLEVKRMLGCTEHLHKHGPS